MMDGFTGAVGRLGFSVAPNAKYGPRDFARCIVLALTGGKNVAFSRGPQQPARPGILYIALTVLSKVWIVIDALHRLVCSAQEPETAIPLRSDDGDAVRAGFGPPGRANTPARRPETDWDAARCGGQIRACAPIGGGTGPKPARDRAGQTDAPAFQTLPFSLRPATFAGGNCLSACRTFGSTASPIYFLYSARCQHAR